MRQRAASATSVRTHTPALYWLSALFHAAGVAADLTTTLRGVSRGAEEANPIVGMFGRRSKPGIAGVMLSGSSLGMLAIHQQYRTGQKTSAIGMHALAGALHTGAALFNMRTTKRLSP